MGLTIVITVIALSIILIIATAVAQSKHTFACGNCGEKFHPKWTQMCLNFHVFDEHMLKCPHCNETCMCTDKGKII